MEGRSQAVRSFLLCYSRGMLMALDPVRRKAARMLLMATLFWGISFPVMKALGMLQQRLLSHTDTWFAAASFVTVRFGTAALIMLVWAWPTLRRLTALEVWEGAGLGLCAGAGMILQVDGLAYTSASTSAFLTQCCCLLLPWAAAVRDRRWPSLLMVVCSVLAAIGVAVLTGVNWQGLRLGRGEIETLMSSIIFTGQILWLERPVFGPNNVNHFTLVMFAVMALVGLPIGIASMNGPGDWLVAYGSGPSLLLMAILVVFCTMIAFVVMNRWQPRLPAPEAGLLYAAEPVFASIFALFLPATLAVLCGVSYANEGPTFNLVAGGAFITLSNVLIQLRATSAIPDRG
jgi:drug/metabolite transporter (DMT)-like permease